MIRNFKNKSTAEIAIGLNTKRTRKLLPVKLHFVALKKLHILRAAKSLIDIQNFPGLRFEKLSGDRKEEYSIRINAQYRICFRWINGDAIDVSIEDYH